MSDVPESEYDRASMSLQNAQEMTSNVTFGQDQVPEMAQAMATVGAGHAILALCDEIRELRAGRSPNR